MKKNNKWMDGRTCIGIPECDYYHYKLFSLCTQEEKKNESPGQL